MTKPIILIGGAPGAGKTTLANSLLCHLQLDHKLGSGFIREIIRTIADPTQNPSLFTFSYGGDHPATTLVSQAKDLLPAIEACIHRAREEGTSLVIEGTHVIPELYAQYQKLGVSDYIILETPLDTGDHRARLTGTTHLYRDIDPSDFQNIRRVNDYYIQTTKSQGLKSFVCQDQAEVVQNLALFSNHGSPVGTISV